MESIERIGPPAPLEMGGPDGHIGTMRDFLAKPRVARDFQDLKADSHRLESLRAELTTLTQRAAEAEIDAGRIARSDDEYRRHRLSYGAGVLLATLLVLLDTLPANLAAQTFGLDALPTWGITAVIIGALAAGMWAVTHYKGGWRRNTTIAALTVGLVSIGALRYWFLWVTAGDALAAILEAVALTVFTTMMVWLGVLVLSFTKSRHVSVSERGEAPAQEDGADVGPGGGAKPAIGRGEVRVSRRRSAVLVSRLSKRRAPQPVSRLRARRAGPLSPKAPHL